MTNDTHDDPLLAALRDLRTCDVGSDRADRLRSRCRKALAGPDSSRPSRSREADIWPRSVCVVAGAWCLVYMFETIRRAAAVYGFE